MGKPTTKVQADEPDGRKATHHAGRRNQLRILVRAAVRIRRRFPLGIRALTVYMRRG
jgi:hypothetical protein